MVDGPQYCKTTNLLSEKFNNQGTLYNSIYFIVTINYVTFINTPFISGLKAVHILSYSLRLHVMAQTGHHNLVLCECFMGIVNLVFLLALRISC